MKKNNNADGQTISTTVSIGVATIYEDESVDRLLQRADEALYEAKTRGRNLVHRHGALNSRNNSALNPSALSQSDPSL